MTAEQRNIVLMQNMRCINSSVKALYTMHTITSHEYEDFFQVAVIIAIKAIEEYSPKRKASIATYIRHRIAWGLVDYIRANSESKRQSFINSNKIQNTILLLVKELGRMPSTEDIIKKLNWTIHKYNTILGNSTKIEIQSLITGYDKKAHNANHILGKIVHLIDSSPSVLEKLEEEELLAALHDGIKKLSEKEKYIIKAYYTDNKYNKDIAAELGLHESRVSQIQIEVRKKLRLHLKEYYEKSNSHIPVVQ